PLAAISLRRGIARVAVRADYRLERSARRRGHAGCLRRFSHVAPRDANRIRTLAAMFASLALFAATKVHAATSRAQGCTVTDTSGADILRGTPGRDVICGLGGNDALYGVGGNDILMGGPGDDQLSGVGGDDVLYGGPGNYKLQGGIGRDTVYGGDGRDMIWAW